MPNWVTLVVILTGCISADIAGKTLMLIVVLSIKGVGQRRI